MFYIIFNLVILFIVFRDIFIGQLDQSDFNEKTIEDININKLNLENDISNILAITLTESLIKLQGLLELFKNDDYGKPILLILNILLNIT